MTTRLRALTLAGVAAAFPLSGCGSYEKTLAAVGAVGCGAIGSSIKGGGKTGRLARGLFGGASCAIVGGLIGHALDERDRQQMQSATYAVLNQPVPPSFYRYQAVYQQPAYLPPPPRPRYLSTAPSYSSRPAYRSTPEESGEAPANAGVTVGPPVTTPDTPAQPLPGGGHLPNVPRAPEAQWVSDHSSATGSATVVAVDPATDEHGECKTVRNVAAVPGEGLQSHEDKFCQDAPGSEAWTQL